MIPLISNEVNQLLKSLTDTSTKVVHVHFELHTQSVHAQVQVTHLQLSS